MNILQFFENLFGVPWGQLMQIWQQAIVLLFTHFLLFTIVLYVVYVAILVINDAIDTIVKHTFYFLCVYLLFASPISGMYGWLEVFLRDSGILIPKFLV